MRRILNAGPATRALTRAKAIAVLQLECSNAKTTGATRAFLKLALRIHLDRRKANESKLHAGSYAEAFNTAKATCDALQ